MAETIYTVELDGSQMDNFEDSALSLTLYGSCTLKRLKAKKSIEGGKFAFNIDASASKANKFPYIENVLVDLNPNQIRSQYADGDDISTALNAVDGADLTAPSGSQPTFASSGTNLTTYPAIDIGSSSRLQVSSSPPTFAAGEPFTVALVVDQADNSNKPAMGSDNASGRFSYATWYGNNASRQVYFRDESSNSINGSGTDDYIQDEDIRVLTRDSSNVVTEYRRGVQTMTGTVAGTCDFGCIGWLSQNFNFMNQDFIWGGLSLSRVLVIKGDLSTTDRQLVEGWLAYQYGLQSAGGSYLPTGHPWKASSPITSINYSYNSDIDLDALAEDTFSTSVEPDTDTIAGELSIIPTKAYKAGTVTIEITIEHL